jgi:hypothetical protein
MCWYPFSVLLCIGLLVRYWQYLNMSGSYSPMLKFVYTLPSRLVDKLVSLFKGARIDKKATEILSIASYLI